MNDLRYALRQLARSPGFTAVAVLTLALGAGTNSLLFSVIHAVLLRPLPYPDPDRIVAIGLVPRGNTIARMDAQATHWAYFEWRDESRSFAHLAAYRQTQAIVRGGAPLEDMRGAEITTGFLPLFGVQPALGRTFTADEQQGTGPAVVLLSHRLWQTRFGADPAIVGRTVIMDEEPVTVVGVLPATFDFPRGATFWRPLSRLPTSGGKTWTTFFVRVVGPLAPGFPLTQARARVRNPRGVRWRPAPVSAPASGREHGAGATGSDRRARRTGARFASVHARRTVAGGGGSRRPSRCRRARVHYRAGPAHWSCVRPGAGSHCLPLEPGRRAEERSRAGGDCRTPRAAPQRPGGRGARGGAGPPDGRGPPGAQSAAAAGGRSRFPPGARRRRSYGTTLQELVPSGTGSKRVPRCVARATSRPARRRIGRTDRRATARRHREQQHGCSRQCGTGRRGREPARGLGGLLQDR